MSMTPSASPIPYPPADARTSPAADLEVGDRRGLPSAQALIVWRSFSVWCSISIRRGLACSATGIVSVSTPAV